MKYEQPYGVSDPNAPYINGNPAVGLQGSIPPAAAFEYPMRELVAMIAGGGFTPSDSDLQQLLKAVRSQLVNYCVDQGTLPNNYIATFNPPVTTYQLGMPFRLRIANTNTGPSSFDAGGGRHPIKRYGGADPSAGDIVAGSVVELLWDGTNFEMTNFNPGTGTGSPPPVVVSALVNVQVFYVSGTYLPTTGASKALFFCTAGGASGSVACGGGGGGGGAGATSIAVISSMTGIVSLPVVVGAGGPQVTTDHSNGLNGGDSSVGPSTAYVAYARGGNGAIFMGSGDTNPGGLGGSTQNAVGILVTAGGDGLEVAQSAGGGGASFWGGGGMAYPGPSTTGAPGRALGAGGGGGMDIASGAGAHGVVLVLEF